MKYYRGIYQCHISSFANSPPSPMYAKNIKKGYEFSTKWIAEMKKKKTKIKIK